METTEAACMAGTAEAEMTNDHASNWRPNNEVLDSDFHSFHCDFPLINFIIRLRRNISIRKSRGGKSILSEHEIWASSPAAT